MKPPSVPLTAKPFDQQTVSLCAGCGCGCGYVLYKKEGSPTDLYGHPADPRGMGSLCSKGIAYIQETYKNPLRLLGANLNEEGPRSLSYHQALNVAKEKLGGRIAVVLDRRLSGLEEYFLAKSVGDVFVDAPVVDFKPSTVFFNRWQDAKVIVSWEAEPVFSEVMSMRYVVDAVEKGAHLVCVSSRFSTMCSKAKTKLLLNPFEQIKFMKSLLEPEHRDATATALKKKLYLLGGLILINTSLLSSPFRGKVLNILKELIKHFKVDYSFVGDLMPLPAMELEEFAKKSQEYDSFILFGNPLMYVPEDVRRLIKKRFSVHFTLFPNLTSHYSKLIVGCSNFTERDFVAYRNAFGEVYRCPQSLQRPDGAVVPYEFLSEVFGIEVRPEEVRRELPSVRDKDFEEEDVKEGVVLYVDDGLVDELGHWNPWTHQMERYQKAYLSPSTAEKLGIRDKLELSDREFEIFTSANVADNLVYIPSSFEEFQPFDPGHSVGSFCRHPFHRYEVWEC